MRFRSLRFRLVLGAAVWIAAALVLAGAAIAYLFTDSLERNVRADISATMSRLVALIDPDAPAGAPVLTGALPDARYETPASGIYWQVTDLGSGARTRSRSLWDHVLATGPEDEGRRFATVDGPLGQSLLSLSLLARFPAANGERRYEVVVAQDRASLDGAIRRFGFELAVALLLLGLVLALAALLQVQLGLAPLRRLRQDVEAIRKGAAVSVGAAYPSEVLPLVGEVNELLVSQGKSMEFARARAADLAHGLKTPLAVLGTLEYELGEKGEDAIAAQIAELTREMSERIDYQMRLARLRQRTRLHSFTAPLSRIVCRAVAVLQRTQQGERCEWRVDVAEALDVDMDADDLVELVGVILENAAQWARSRISIEARVDGMTVELRIEDDGPGIAPDDLASIGERGRRLDETMPGTGLSLAIAREIVTLNQGTITFGQAEPGGLAVAIRLPKAP
ncbi:ATPase [Aureimonas endophytica]|uniref:histidine kinase n=1 Tax=Aureimonas endophytica TaxID=2027858 RepID=A0A916ZLN3_9HYPH|nr:HAMP domain-containing sensor histidine kinase [Aureimonas endophytica]GGE03776.1 ATPase [Aureimonas endophytica]